VHAHGDFPHKIIEVDPTLVESFLGRIEDPQNTRNTTLNIIDDAAFRILMAIRIEKEQLKKDTKEELRHAIHQSLENVIAKYNGSPVKQKDDGVLASFDSVTNAIQCAVESHAISTPTNSKIKIG